MWLNSTLVFLGDFRVFVQERWETGDIFGDVFFGVPGELESVGEAVHRSKC